MNINFIQKLSGHKEPIYQILLFDEQHFLTASGDGMIVKWNVNSFHSTALAKCNSGVFAICLIEKKLLAIGTNEGILHLLDLAKNKIIQSLKLSVQQIFTIQYVKNYQCLYIGDGEGQLTVFDLKDMQADDQKQIANNSLRTIAVNPAESLMALGTSENNISIVSLPELKPLSELKASENSVFCSEFLNDVQLISGGRDAHLRLWNTIEETELKSIPAHFFTINDIALQPELLATASRDKSVKIWNRSNLDLLKVISTEKYPDLFKHSMNTVIWMNDKLICGGDDRKIFLWRVQVD